MSGVYAYIYFISLDGGAQNYTCNKKYSNACTKLFIRYRDVKIISN